MALLLLRQVLVNAIKPLENEAVAKSVKRICAWCNKDLDPESSAKGITHGICAECCQKLLDDIRQEEVLQATPHLN